MGKTLRLGERELELRLSARAEKQLARQRQALDIEMELYFSCLIRKRVHFRAPPINEVAVRAVLTDNVSVSFRPVTSRACSVREAGEAPDVVTLPLVRLRAFTPKWLAVDYARGVWSGNFGY
jgi:hypothetical protein